MFSRPSVKQLNGEAADTPAYVWPNTFDFASDRFTATGSRPMRDAGCGITHSVSCIGAAWCFVGHA